MDKKDGYEFVYPFGWQEVSIEGQDKVFKDVIEPLETASVTLFPTVKEDIKEFGTPQEVRPLERYEPCALAYQKVDINFYAHFAQPYP